MSLSLITLRSNLLKSLSSIGISGYNVVIPVRMSLRRVREICKKLAAGLIDGAGQGASCDNIEVEERLSLSARRRVR